MCWAHGDAQFRPTRKSARLLPTGEFWEQNAAFHDWLCGQRQPHLPVRLGADINGPAALAWLIPAPDAGAVSATGFAAAMPFGCELRKQWLLTWAAHLPGVACCPAHTVAVAGSRKARMLVLS